ncbi:hypothetical protein KAFR_0C01790 [Kazachstania africana CBS 2517]|uniref:ATP synthase F(0) complex subunit e, mitochondrial n=1 Tax=Kazachstania africana (strain ATCC 22294 / BCRC 22015 / CBS 2517 / CECT 1963 / NBRC 1671 / NRRL Y-8276) TaxID=1071382 RepID=H2AS22_KAZAF|nr:hypothetical protein KAFR_0C01790 [Kazachstania africana CBS 2517]CCF57172.1 hypothetical protein KAFR_0C01790 [Kazachstania africana CBS 2517]
MSTINVLRYSALGLGLVVGFKTDWSLRSAAKRKKQELEYQEQVKLIEEARAEYAKLYSPMIAKQGNVDFEDPNLDYAAVIMNAVTSLKST